MERFLLDLNPAQLSAVTSPSNVLQILAPPGSGKTKTLTSRVAHLIQHCKYKPWNILCLTFTIKSAREMKERLARLMEDGLEAKLVLGTFHSVCRRYLVSYGHLIGLCKGFGIVDSSDSLAIIKRVVKRLRLGSELKATQSRISNLKSRGITHHELARDATQKKAVEQHEFLQIYAEYEDHLDRSNLLDYDDLLLRCRDLLRLHPSCVSNVEAVLIDEFQDTNVVQFDLMRLFAAHNNRVTTVGDPDQSIYGWRSAEIGNLYKMRQIYGDALVVLLDANYRSSATILLAAKEVIEQDESRPLMDLSPTHCAGSVPVLRRLPSAEAEASWVVCEIQRSIGLTGGLLTHADYAVLLRSAALSRHLESAMGRAGIPYRMVGGHRFFDRVEIKILLDYLRVISQPNNNDALARIINVPARGIGQATIKSLLEEAELGKTSVWSLIRNTVTRHFRPKMRITKPAEQALGALINLILTARQKVNHHGGPSSPRQLLGHIISKLRFNDYLKNAYEIDHENRWANVEELLSQSCEYSVLSEDDVSTTGIDDALPTIEGIEQTRTNAGEEALSKFLANVALATELQREDQVEEGQVRPQVTISTIHAAKGLEWPAVFIPSAYEGSIPHSRADNTDEERRLLYVAMTRAKALLYLSCPIKNSQKEDSTLSQFLTPRSLKSYLTNKGPKFDTRTISDIACILKRPLPLESTLAKGFTAVKNSEDDLWPLNGDEANDKDSAGWSKHQIAIEREDQANQKRRRTLGDHDVKSFSRQTISNAVPTSMVAVGSTTTMEESPSFTCQANGFTSAAAQLRLQQEQEGFGMARNVLQPKTGNSLATIKAGADGFKPRKESRKRYKRQGAQGDLTRFWSLEPKIDVFPTRPELPSSHSHPIQIPMQAESTAAAPDHEAELRKEASRSAERPLPSIPQPLAARKLTHPTSCTPPHSLVRADMERSHKPYIFLSSSPPPAHSPEKRMKVGAPPQDAYVSIQQEVFRPAVAFHNTSIGALRQISDQRRTLGVRRSMNGWANRAGGGGSSVPKKG
ncbi:MAG: hypothetical protein Q9190_000322 [Brigantiaea leucoxantha]